MQHPPHPPEPAFRWRIEIAAARRFLKHADDGTLATLAHENRNFLRKFAILIPKNLRFFGPEGQNTTYFGRFSGKTAFFPKTREKPSVFRPVTSKNFVF